MVKVLNITISDRKFIFCFAYFFRPRIGTCLLLYLKSCIFELGRLMLSVCPTMIRLLCRYFSSGDEANSVNRLRGV